MTPGTKQFLAKSKTIPETSIFAKHILSKSCENLYQNNGENMNNGVLKPWKSKEIRDVGPRDDWKPPLPGTQGPYTIGVSPGVRCFTAQATTWPNQGPQELPNPCKSKNNQCENRFRKSKRKKHENRWKWTLDRCSSISWFLRKSITLKSFFQKWHLHSRKNDVKFDGWKLI